ncbi:MFS transporter [Methanorbis furvi]|uniref:Fosmidomycin resistance protein n=1 Tax=Methanorbis furvi TaxID=3028299 RepID=A0AAE4S9W0_9EURY|nr:Fosmidomycin resistance protein [Methanocorpusculaceae archaeon Ag1]
MDESAGQKIRGVIFGHFLIDIYTPILALILPLLIAGMDLSYFLAGMIVTVFNVTSSVSQPFVGWYGDKTGWRASVPLCLVIGSVGISLTAVTGNYVLLLFLAAGAAIGHALFHPAAMDIMYRLSPPAKRGLYNSIFTTSGSIGYAVGPLIAGILIVVGGLPAVAWLMIPGILGATWMYRNNRRSRGKSGAGTKAKVVEKNASEAAPRKRFWWVPAGLVVSICSLRAWAYLGVITYLPTLLILGHHGMDMFTASAIVTVMLFFGVAGQVVGGYMSDRFGRKEMLVLGLACAIPFFCLIFSTNEVLMYFGVMMYAFFASSCYVMSVTMTQDLLPGNVGFASGLTLGFSMGVGGLGAALIGWAADVLGSLSSAMFLLIVPIILCPVLALLIKYPLKSLARGHDRGADGDI